MGISRSRDSARSLRFQRRLRHRPISGALTLSAVFVVLGRAPEASAGPTGEHPAFSVPQPNWGELRPADVGQLPAERDQTAFDEFCCGGWFKAHLFQGAAVAGSRLLVAENLGVSSWDLTQPSKPKFIGRFSYGAATGFAKYPSDPHALTHPVRQLSALNDSAEVAALACDGAPIGFVLVQTAAVPWVLYQDSGDGKFSTSAYLGRTGGVRTAFFARGSLPMRAYSVEAALAQTSRCVEDAPLSVKCGKVFIGEGFSATYSNPVSGKPSIRFPRHVDGTGDTILTVSDFGADLWNASEPDQPLKLGGISGLGYGSAGTIWESGGATFAALANGTGIDVFDVSNGSFAKKVVSIPTPFAVGVLQASRATNANLVYAAEAVAGQLSTGASHEAVYDMTSPAAPREVTPPPVAGVSYWGHYYKYGRVSPRTAVFGGSHLYRAAFGILDVHVWTPPSSGTPDAGTGGTAADGSAGAAGAGVGGNGGSGAVDGGHQNASGGGEVLHDSERATPPAPNDAQCVCRMVAPATNEEAAVASIGAIAMWLMRRRHRPK